MNSTVGSYKYVTIASYITHFTTNSYDIYISTRTHIYKYTYLSTIVVESKSVKKVLHSTVFIVVCK